MINLIKQWFKRNYHIYTRYMLLKILTYFIVNKNIIRYNRNVKSVSLGVIYKEINYEFKKGSSYSNNWK